MSTQTLEQVETVELQPLIRRISALPDKSLSRLSDFVEELIEELEDEDDIAYLDSLTPEQRDPANAIPFEEIIAEIEAEFGLLDEN